MKDNRTRSINIRLLTLTALLLSAVLVTGACTKKNPQGNDAKTAGAPKVEAHKKEVHEEGMVRLDPDAVKTAGIEIQKVTSDNFVPSLSATAVIEPNSDRISRVGARVTGRIAKVTAMQGDRVKTGQTLAYLESVDLDQAWADYAKAKGKRSLAAANLKREETLFQKKVTPEKDVLKARQEFSEAEADVALNEKRLRILGVEQSKVNGSSDGIKNNHHLILIPSPINGVVIQKTVTQGEMVNPDKVLFTVSDLSSLWVVIDIYEKDLSRVRTGIEAKLLVAAYPNTAFKGRISYVGDVMDEKTRTVKARVTIDNGKGLLKPGMFATVSMDSLADSRTEKTIVIPEEAVFRDGSETYVFLSSGEGKFAARQVLTGPASGEKIEIKEGLKAGDLLVTRGAFALKSELKKEALGEDSH